MPKVKCDKCGTEHYGWALHYMQCYCKCGNLISKEVKKVKKIPYFELKVVKVKKQPKDSATIYNQFSSSLFSPPYYLEIK